MMNFIAETTLTLLGVILFLYALVVVTRITGCGFCQGPMKKLDGWFANLESACFKR